MDNASYHNLRVPGTESPTMAWTKPKIIEWLRTNNIPHCPTMLKPELYVIAKRNKKAVVYQTDQLANEQGHVVLRTPVRYWIFNPIEMIWSQVKGFIAEQNKTFKIADVQKLVPQAFQTVTVDKWRAAVMHVIETENSYWANDGLQFSEIEPVVINFDSSDSDSSDLDVDSDLDSDES